PGLQGGPHINQIAATAIALYEAQQPGFKRYALQVVKNARALSDALKKHGWRIVSGGTDTHLLLVDVISQGITGKDASDLLEKIGIIVNKNTIPYDERPPMNPSGIRIGTPTITSRGMKENEMRKIAELIHQTLLREVPASKVKKAVLKLCREFPIR
ncbi:unnamed protein product, partial [marine sediment metagenome]